MYDESTDSTFASRCEWISRFCAIAVAGLGAGVLIGWALDITMLKSLLPEWATMKANTALGFLLAGAALLAADLKKTGPGCWRNIHLALAAIVTLLGLLTLGEYALAVNFSIDQLLFTAQGEPISTASSFGRMAEATAAGLLFTGLALLLLDSRRGRIGSQAAALVGILIGILAILSYAYNVAGLYGFSAYGGVALHTSIGLVVINLGMLLARPQRAMMAVVASQTVGGVMARRLLPFALLAPFLIGWLRVRGEHWGIISSEFGVALVQLTYITLFSTLIWRTAEKLGKSDRNRSSAERVQRGQQAQLTGIIDSAMDAIITVDGAQRVVLFNPAAAHMFGRQAADVLGGPLDVLLPQRFRAAHFGHFQTFGTTGATSRRKGHLGTITGVRENGEEFPIEASISRLDTDGKQYFTVILRDISATKGAEEALRESEAKFRMLANTIPQLAWIAHADGYIYWYNERWYEYTGTMPQQMEGRGWKMVLDQDSLPAVLERWQASIATGKPFEVTVPLRRADGQFRPFLTRCMPLLDSNQRVLQWFGTNTDITEQKEMEEALRHAKIDAERANAAKSAFLSTMSHEIRTPLNAVIGLTGLLADSALDRRQRNYAEKLLLSAQALRLLVDDILDFSKIEAGALQLEQAPFSLNAILRTVAAVVSAGIRDKSIEALFDVAADTPDALIGDAMRLQQILLNLTSNAVKFTEAGEMVVSVHCLAREAGRVTLQFSVRDTGIGIPTGQLSQIFEVFVQSATSTTRLYGGTGLGLAISSQLANLMGSQISVDSEMGRGSEFHFAVTLAIADSAQPVTPAAIPSALNILIIDDHHLARDILKQACIDFGWQATVLDSGAAGLDELRRSGAEGSDYDIMLLDWRMPGMDGIEMLRQAYAAPDIGLPQVVLMASIFELEQAAAASDGIYLDGILAKPIMQTSLLDAVARALDGDFRGILSSPHKTDRRLSGMRLLVAEDNAINQQVIEQILTRAGAEVAIAGNGVAALDTLRLPGARFDAVLMDIQMPVMDGYTATRIILEEMDLVDLPIIAVTAYAQSEDQEKSRLAGMAGHIIKPLDIEDLLDILAKRRKTFPGHSDERHDSSREVTAPERHIPGINAAAALKSFGGDKKKYVELLRQFVVSHGDDVNKARRLFSAADPKGAANVVHGLRGVASILQATEVARLAAELTGALRGGHTDTVPPLLDELQFAINALGESTDRFGSMEANVAQEVVAIEKIWPN